MSHRFPSNGPRLLERLGWCLTAAAVVCVLEGGSVFGPLEDLAYDVRVRWLAASRPASADIVIVAIDAASLRRLEPNLGPWPWPRGVYAGLVDYCAAASVIGLDIVFTQRGAGLPDGDALFAEAVRAAGNVVVAALFDHPARRSEWPGQRDAPGWAPAGEGTEGVPRFASVDAPFPELAAAAAAVGHVNCEPDADGVLRRYLAALRFEERVAPALAIEMARRHWGLGPSDVTVTSASLRIGSRRFPLDGTGGMLMKYAAREAFTPTAFPISDVLEAYRDELHGRPPRVSREAFRGKLVLVGSTTPGMYADHEATPTSGTTPGVVIHANALDNLLSGEVYQRPPGGVTWLILVGLTLAPAGFPTIRPLPMVGGLAAAAAGWVALAVAAAWWGGWMLPVAAPLGGLALSGATLGVRRWYGELMRRSRLEQLDQAKQRFTDMLVHDLKGHTSAIQMSLTLLKRRLPPEDGRSLRLLQTAEAGGNRLLEQIYALLDIRRMQEGRMQLRRIDARPEDLLLACVAQFAPAAELSGVRLTATATDGNLSNVSIDVDILSRVLGNLVWNAIQYAEAGSEIELGAAPAGVGAVDLYVANQGRVISREQQEAVFEVFVSGAMEDKEVKVPSSGLGLAFCKLAVEAHGGSIRIRSPWLDGGGVKVIVTLPASEPAVHGE